MTSPSNFSQRYGLARVRPMQLSEMDDELRNGLWNVIHFTFFAPRLQVGQGGHYVCDATLRRFILKLASEVVKVRDHFNHVPWNQVYEFVEFVANNPDRDDVARMAVFLQECNRVLERELSGYRFVGKQLVRITDSSELEAIEAARSQPTRLASVQMHLDTAMRHMSDRERPDYRNSIKESICAIEGFCSLLAGQEKADLDSALRKLEATLTLHPALKKAFKQLYGYSSDSSGIRHALLDETTLEFEDAKFMLVACAAFINYMSALAARAKVTLADA